MDIIKGLKDITIVIPVDNRLKALDDSIEELKNYLKLPDNQPLLNTPNILCIYIGTEDESESDEDEAYFMVNTIECHVDCHLADSYPEEVSMFFSNIPCITDFMESHFGMCTHQENKNEESIITQRVYDTFLGTTVDRIIGMAKTYDYSIEEQKIHLSKVIDELIKYPAFGVTSIPW